MMAAHTPPPPNLQPSKRIRQSSPDRGSPTSLSAGAGGANSPAVGDASADASSVVSGGGASGAKASQSSNFRNVSACNRCRLRKNRCDQRLPSCASCEKANVACVGYDPITKKEIPRSYVFYLETRVGQLEALLRSHDIPFPAADDLEHCSRPVADLDTTRSPAESMRPFAADELDVAAGSGQETSIGESGALQKPVSRPGYWEPSGGANAKYSSSLPGVSFSRVVLAAVQSSVSDQRSVSEKAGIRPSKPNLAGASSVETGTSMRDSFFGLHTRPTIHPAPFPDIEIGRKLVTLYFEHANPQLPVLHKGEFLHMFEQAYAEGNKHRAPKELYMLNMVFAIGGAIILGDSAKSAPHRHGPLSDEARPRQCQPEEYHASAIVHFEACLSQSGGGGLTVLQAVLLLANFALLRPVPPGLWYIVGVALRLAVDLGLHYEDGKDVDADMVGPDAQNTEAYLRERGRREYVRDLRRRLWWCTYSFDRLVSVCVGRPFGISDQVITTEFPSLLDDKYITPTGFLEPAPDVAEPTYKLVAHHYFRLRLLQSEILQVLQYQQAQFARAAGQNRSNPFMHTRLPSPFLSKYDSFRTWRIDIDRRLYEWKTSAPTKAETGVDFSIEFLDLNYWQTIIMLYRQSLGVPAVFEGEYHTAKEVNSPTVHNVELREDEDRVYLKVAEAGQKILRLYRQLHLVGVVNYTYLATHHLFTAGISYLYAIWHSPIVRSRLSMDEVDFTILAAISVFTDLIDKCPPAEACRDAFDRTAKATIKMVNSTGGFGQSLYSSQNQMQPNPDGGPENRPEWFPPKERGSGPTRSHRQQHHHHHRRPSTDRSSNRSSTYFDMPSSADRYYNSASSTSSFTTAQDVPTRMSGRAPRVKSDVDSFSQSSPVLRTTASNTSGLDASFRPPDSTRQSLQLRSGATFSQQQQQQQQLQLQQAADPSGLSPETLDLADLQGMEFLQGLTEGVMGTVGGEGGVPDFGVGAAGLTEGQMDMNFGIGWEGLHHDFSDGQQFDLFDGFFFGDQRGGGGLAGSGAGAEMAPEGDADGGGEA
ncbi:hypothetical protein VTK73DRAFT_10419 [Phialemonium thermophilum]|uniref:Zn(2)-C6 fungal-type domain-containing protein n=1 Tax=Phialemonium thermophilum TaxID=223376 RepID=A0ABR3VWV9_9PEZI